MKTKKRETTTSLATVQDHKPTEHHPIVATQAEPDTKASDDEVASLSKVRELLFGEQARETDQRLHKLESHFSDEIRRIEGDVSERMENLSRDLYARLHLLERQIASVENALQEHIGQSTEQMEALRVELAERIVDSAHTLNRRITESHEKAIIHAEKASEALEETKVGREALAGLLSELSSRVGR